MRVYSFNRGIGWASSGVEYAQAYRNQVFEKLGVDGKFIFTDMFRRENIEHYTANLGFQDQNIIWLYSAFTDVPVSPCRVPLAEIEKSFADSYRKVTLHDRVQYVFPEKNSFVNAYYSSQDHGYVQRVETVVGGFLLRTDYYTCVRLFSEFWAPKEGKACLYLRRFYNMDGSTAYEELIGAGKGYPEGSAEISESRGSLFRFSDRLVEGKEKLIRFLTERIAPQKGDLILIDRATEIGRAVMDAHGDAQMAAVIHAEHFSEKSTNDENILWNNYYEYTFSQAGRGMWYIASTEKQREIFLEQMRRYRHAEPRVYAIPVGSLKALKYPDNARFPHSLITASRLAGEKHIDWLIRAVAEARQSVPDLSLDIYGKGAEEQRLRNLIGELGADRYIRLMGHRNLDNIYVGYEGYIAGSTSEGFGLTLMEAVGSGLGMIGFDVRYGNITFIQDGENGVLLPFQAGDDAELCVRRLQDGIVRLFTSMDMETVHRKSYAMAENFLEDKVMDKWKKLLEDMKFESER